MNALPSIDHKNPLDIKTKLSTRTIFTWLTSTLLFFGVFTPIYPSLPTSGLDPSWIFGIQEAIANGLNFGKDIIYTFGPYAALYTKLYHPSTDFLTLLSGAFLSALYTTLFLAYFRSNSLLFSLILSLALCSLLLINRDTLLFSYPLLLSLSFLGFVARKNSEQFPELIFYLGVFGLGLLPLIKGSLLPICISTIVFCVLLALTEKMVRAAILSVLLPFISTLFFWIISGQNIFTLDDFFINLIPVISGYTNSMATTGDPAEIIAFLVAYAVLLVCIALQPRPTLHHLFILLNAGLFLFLSFKAGVVRQDHSKVAFSSILVAIFLLARYTPRLAMLATISAGIAAGTYTQTYDQASIPKNIIKLFSETFSGIKIRTSQVTSLEQRFHHALDKINQRSPLEKLEGTSDIYSYDQTQLLASGNSWSPRPIFQSYAAYTPALAKLNEAHLRSKSAPNNIFFKIQPIDNRLPALEDGPSWPTILRNYVPVKFNEEQIIFRKQNSSEDHPLENTVLRKKARLGENILLPSSGGALFAHIKVHPSTLGKLSTLAFKSSTLSINLKLSNDAERNFQFIPGMGEAGFIISPLIENTFELLATSSKETSLYKHKEVASFSITAGSKLQLWDQDIQIEISSLDLPRTFTSLSVLFAKEVPELAPLLAQATPTDCEGNMDNINGTPAFHTNHVDGILEIDGWNSISTEKGTLPDSVYLSLTDTKGKMRIFETKALIRPDVSDYFRKPSLKASGFKSRIDIRQLEGKQTIGIFRKNGEEMEQCRQFALPIQLH